MAQHNKGVDIEDDKDLIAKMRKNHNGDILSEEESDNFLLKLRKTSLHWEKFHVTVIFFVVHRIIWEKYKAYPAWTKISL